MVPPYYPRTVSLEKYDHLTPFFDGALIPGDLRAHGVLSKEEMLYLCSTMWKLARGTGMSLSGKLDGENAVKEVWGHGETMST